MKNLPGVPQLFLRIALSISFILAVMDRFGWLGKPGTSGVSWGDWSHFSAYTNTLMPFLNSTLVNVAAFIATVAECTFGIFLILGLRVREIGLGIAILTFIFGLCMALTQGINAPFAYPVFVFTGAGLLLAVTPSFKWSLDGYLARKEG